MSWGYWILFYKQMTIINGKIASPPKEYEAYLYRFTNKNDGKMYIGYHKGAVVDKYQHSSTNKEFNDAFSDPNSSFVYDVLSYGSSVNMLQLESQYLTQVDARNNSKYYNKTNGIQQHAIVDLEKVKSLVKDIRDGSYPKTLEDIQTHVDMASYQVRFQHDDKHQKEIKESVDLANGDTVNCFGKGQGLQVVVFEGRGGNGGDLRVDGNHSVYGASKSKHCTRIQVIRVPYYINKDITDAELSTFSNLLNPRSAVRRKETDEATAIKYVLDQYKKSSIPLDSESNIKALNAFGFSGTVYTGKTKFIIQKAKDIVTKEEGRDAGRVWINYSANPHSKTIISKVNKWSGKDGWCSAKCSSAYYRLDRAMEEIYDANQALEEGETEVTNCKFFIFHPTPTAKKIWDEDMGPKWAKVQEMTVNKHFNIEIFEMPTWLEDIQD